MAKATKILVVDDEKDIRDAIELLLIQEDYQVSKAENGMAAINYFQQGGQADLIIMDIKMPELTGIDATDRIRDFSDCPVIFLTAKSADEDKVDAYQSGGDDYLTKPFSSVELLLRVKALLKRYKRVEKDEIQLDRTTRRALKNGKEILLTEREYELLKFFMDNKDKVFTTGELYENVWSEKYFQSSSNTVMVHILNLRKKLEDNFAEPKHLQTVWGKGYCYED